MTYSLINGADRVVEQGTSGNWHYRKWSSGLAECWGTHACTGLNLTSQSGGTYYGNAASINLPSGLFTSITGASAQASIVPYRSGHSSGIFVYQVNGATTGKVEIAHRAFSSTQNGSCDTFVQVWGTWK